MRFFAKLLLFCLFSISCRAAAERPAADTDALKTRSLTELENRLAVLDAERNRLARFTPRGGAGSVGWSSQAREKPDHTEWAGIQLAGHVQIDRIVLVPMLMNDSEKGLQADGFPENFEVLAGERGDTEGKVIARFSPEDRLLPRVAPLVIDMPPRWASWVRIRAPRLPQSVKSANYIFGLSEVMVFSGERNVALARPADCSSVARNWGGEAISASALTDGFTPYLVDVPHGKSSKAYLARFGAMRNFWLCIDLEKSCPVDEIQIHGAPDITTPIPQPRNLDYGLPPHLTVEGANRADFSDAIPLLDYQREPFYSSEPMLVRNIPGTYCRYIRLWVPQAHTPPEATGGNDYFYLAEIKIISNGINVAEGKKIASIQRIMEDRKESITDGSNSSGEILPIRAWMAQLARRHELERERPLLVAELTARYARQKRHLLLMYWAASVLIAMIGVIALIERMLHMRHVARIRQRFAADLHDELAGNLHTIGLLGDTAQAVKNEPEKLDTILNRIRALTERSGAAARHCVNLIEATGLFGDLPEELHHISARVLTDLNHTISIRGEAMLRQLPPRKRVDLLLFYKECLINIIRHSGATAVTTRLIANKKNIALTVTDNGHGTTQTPSSLKRRARLLGATITSENPPKGGTKISLTLHPRKLGFRK